MNRFIQKNEGEKKKKKKKKKKRHRFPFLISFHSPFFPVLNKKKQKVDTKKKKINKAKWGPT